MTGGSPIPCNLTPLDVLRRWPTDRPVALLHSGRVHPDWSRYSILAQPDGQMRLDSAGFHRPGQAPATVDDPFQALQDQFDREPDTLWLGYLGYDLGRWVEEIPSIARDPSPWPILQFERCPGWLVYDTVDQSWHGFGTWTDGAILRDLPTAPAPSNHAAGPAHPEQTRDRFEQSIQQVKDYIAAGDVFQVNVAQRFSGDFEGSPRGLFLDLAEKSPAWYGAYLELNRIHNSEPNRALVSVSPELFLQCDSAGKIVTRPIKGTLPASHPAKLLQNSEKDAAELAMIVDLLRNDLGRVCRVGSVRVREARVIETHPTIHHGVATIVGELGSHAALADLLRAAMPGGSITGAPKVRAMQIIEELEPVRRGPYCGAIGWVRGRSATFNIAIRTILTEQGSPGPGSYSFSVGAGIVADSTPAAEYDETIAKAQAMLHGLGAEITADRSAQMPLQQ